MKRIITAILATLILTGSMVALSVAPAQANHTCRYFTTTQANVDTQLGYNSMFRYHYSPRLYSSNDPHCNRAVVVMSEGWHFQANACGVMWVRMMYPNGTTRVIDQSDHIVCGGQRVQLLCCLTLSAVIRVEGHRFEETQRGPLDGWVATIRT